MLRKLEWMEQLKEPEYLKNPTQKQPEIKKNMLWLLYKQDKCIVPALT